MARRRHNFGPLFFAWRNQLRVACVAMRRDFMRNDYLNYAAAMAFFFLLSLFPLLVILITGIGYLPVPNLTQRILNIMAALVPQAGMGLLRTVVLDILKTGPELFSLGIIATIFAASSGFNTLITVLNMAYDVREGRVLWKKALVALELTLVTGAMVAAALLILVAGPRFGYLLANWFHHGSSMFAALWPYLRWLLIIVFTIFSVETVYFLAPNTRLRFVTQIPGAVLAVLSWIAASWGLSWYLNEFPFYSKTYGAVGAVIALMLWLYVTALAIIIGAEWNAELLKSRTGHLR